MTAQPHQYISSEEYLERELQAETRSEYIFGEVYAMAGTSWAHNLIVTNFVGELRNSLQGGSCRVVSNDMKVKVHDGDVYLSPDVLGLCQVPEFSGPSQLALLNPELVIEVLSPSTQHHDRSKKRLLYQSLPSLKEILFVSQWRAHIEHYTRQSEVFLRSRFYVGLNEVIPLESMACSIGTKEIYANVEFTEEPLV